jgi:hypothetical protein
VNWVIASATTANPPRGGDVPGSGAELYAKPAIPPASYGVTWWPTLRLIT